MAKNNPKIIIDTNLWISFLISKDFSKLDHLILNKNCVLVFSKELLNEFISVVQRPKFKKFFNKVDIEQVVDTVQEYAEFFSVNSNVTICRDPKDNFLLSLVKDSGADYLITGDKDLLEIKNFETAKILTLTEFMEEI